MPGLDTTAQSVALGQLNNLPFGNIIGGPLNAAIEAQAKAAQTTVDFIQAVGFQDNGGTLEAVNLQFIFEDGSGIFRRVTVPLLTVIPVPFIVIDAVDIQFKARIAASAAQSSETRKQSAAAVKADARFRFWGQRLDVSASYSSKKDSKSSQDSKYSVEYTMDVHVHASQSGLPQGMSEILNILQDGIANVPQQTQITVFSLSPVLTTSDGIAFDDTSFKVLLLDASGEPVPNANVTMTTANGTIADITTAITTSADGLATVALAGVASSIPEASTTSDTLQLTIITPGSEPETLTLSRAISIIRD